MMTRGERVIAFIERYCLVPEGEHVGKPIRLLSWQKKFILDVYDNPNGTRRATLSVGRKAGKTTLIACLLLAHIAGPEAQLNSQIVSGALSRDQAALVFGLASKMIQLSVELSAKCRIVPSGKRIIGLARNVEYKALAADGGRAMGLSPVLVLGDEWGQVTGSKNDFIDALLTSQGAHASPLFICISTQAATDAALLSTWIDAQIANPDPKVVCHLYCADEDCELTDRAQWEKANPSLGHHKNLDDHISQADMAMRIPSQENAFRNLMLNQRIASEALFITPKVWQSNALQPEEDAFRYGLVFGGLDLSAKNDLTAFSLAAYHEGRWHIKVWAWTPEKTLLDREKLEKVPYSVWVKQGFIKTVPGASIEYDVVIRDMAEILKGIDVKIIAFDKWHIDFFKQAMTRQGVDFQMEPFGQGYQSMSPAITMLEGALFNESVNHGGNPILNMAIHNAKVESDAAGNKKFTKIKSHGRIDPLIAVTMAIGVSANEIQAVEELDDWLNNPIIL